MCHSASSGIANVIVGFMTSAVSAVWATRVKTTKKAVSERSLQWLQCSRSITRVIVFLGAVTDLLLKESWYSTRKGGSCDTVLLECRLTSRRLFLALITRHQPTNSTILQGMFRQSLSIYQCFLATFVQRMRRTCYLRASGQNSVNAMGFGDPNFLHGINILSIGGHTLAVYRLSDMFKLCTKFQRNRTVLLADVHGCTLFQWTFRISHFSCQKVNVQIGVRNFKNVNKVNPN